MGYVAVATATLILGLSTTIYFQSRNVDKLNKELATLTVVFDELSQANADNQYTIAVLYNELQECGALRKASEEMADSLVWRLAQEKTEGYKDALRRQHELARQSEQHLDPNCAGYKLPRRSTELLLEAAVAANGDVDSPAP